MLRSSLPGQCMDYRLGNVHTSGSGWFFDGNSQPLAATSKPKNVPDPLRFHGNDFLPVNDDAEGPRIITVTRSPGTVVPTPAHGTRNSA